MPEVGYCAAVKVRRERTIIGRPGNSARDLRRLGSAFAPRERRLGWLPSYRLSITLTAAASAADSTGVSTVASVGPEGRPHRPTARRGRPVKLAAGFTSTWATRLLGSLKHAEWRPSARLSVHSTAVLNGLRADEGVLQGERLGGTRAPCRRSGRTSDGQQAHRGSGRQRSIVGPLAGADSVCRHVSRSRDTAMFEPDAFGRRVGLSA